MALNLVNVNVSQVIDQIGFGKFQIFAILVCCMRYSSYGSETSMLVILEPYLRCKLSLDFFSAAMIVLPATFSKMIASPVIGKLADRYGRRNVMLLFFAMHFFTSLLNLLSSSLLMMALTRAAIGLQTCGVTITGTYLMEILPTSARKYMSLLMLAYAFGSMYSILVAMFIMEYLNWRWYIAFTETLPMLVAICFVTMLPESPRFLSVTGQQHASLQVLEKMAEINGKAPGYILSAETDDIGADSTSRILKAEVENPLPRLEIRKRIGFLSLLSFISYAFSITIRFATMQTAENADSVSCGNCTQQLTYKYRWAYGLGLVLAFIATFILTGKLKRATAFRYISILQIIIWTFYYFDPRGWYLMILTVFSCALGSTFTSVLKVYQAEVLPTSDRATGNGIRVAAVQCGFLMGQLLPLYIYHVNSYLYSGIIHGLLVFGFFTTFIFFVETKDKSLQDF